MKAKIIIEGKTDTKLRDFNRNEYGFSISFEVLQDNDLVLDLTGKTVKFKVKEINSITNKVNSVCSITNATSGLCQYTVASVDFNVSGVYDGELEITSGSNEISFKLGRFRILDDLP